MDFRVLVIVAAIAGGVWVGEQVVDGVKTARVKVQHVVKATGAKIGHGLKHLVGQ